MPDDHDLLTRVKSLRPEVRAVYRRRIRQALRNAHDAADLQGAVITLWKVIDNEDGVLAELMHQQGRRWKNRPGCSGSEQTEDIGTILDRLVGEGTIPGSIRACIDWLRRTRNDATHRESRRQIWISDIDLAIRQILRILEWFYCDSPTGSQLHSIYTDTALEPILLSETVLAAIEYQKATWQSGATPVPGMLPRLMPYFRNRTAVLESLRLGVEQSNCPVVIVAGLGGFGKTQLVAKYLSEHANSGKLRSTRWRAILYFRCERADISLRQVLQSAGAALGKPDDFERLASDSSIGSTAKIGYLLAELQRNEPTLMVLDNLEDLLDTHGAFTSQDFESLLRLVLESDQATRLLVTTRRIPAELDMSSVCVITVDQGLPEKEAVEVLSELCGIPLAHASVLHTIARKTMGVPGKIRSAAPLIKAMGTATTQTIDEVLSEIEAFDHERGQAQLVRMQLNMLSEAERLAAGIIALFPKPATLDALLKLAPDLQWSTALKDLLDSLVVSAGDDGIDMHPITKACAVEMMSPEVREGLTLQITIDLMSDSRLAKSDTLRPVRERKRAALMLAHEAHEFAQTSGNSRALVFAALLLADMFQHVKRFREATEHVESATKVARNSGDRVGLFECLVKLVSLESTSNNLFGNDRIFDECWELVEGVGTAGRYRYWVARMNVLMRLRRYEEALSAHKELQAADAALGHQFASDVELRLAECYGHLGVWNACLEHATNAHSGFSREAKRGGVCAALGWMGAATCRIRGEDYGLPLLLRALQTEVDVLLSEEGSAKWLHELGRYFADTKQHKRALEALWLCHELRAEMGHAPVADTQALIQQVANQIGKEQYGLLLREFLPGTTEFAPYAFLFGIPRFISQGHAEQGESSPPNEETHTLAFSSLVAAGSYQKHAIFKGRCGTRNDKWEDIELIVPAGSPFDIDGCYFPDVVSIEGTTTMCYTGRCGSEDRICLALQESGLWRKLGPAVSDEVLAYIECAGGEFCNNGGFPLQRLRCCFVHERICDHYWMYLGRTAVFALRSQDLRIWELVPTPVLRARAGFFDSCAVMPVVSHIAADGMIWLAYLGIDYEGKHVVGQAVLDPDSPGSAFRRSASPILELELSAVSDAANEVATAEQLHFVFGAMGCRAVAADLRGLHTIGREPNNDSERMHA